MFDIRVRHPGKRKTRLYEKQAAGISAGTLKVTEVTLSGFFHKYTVDPSFFYFDSTIEIVTSVCV